MNAIFEFMIRDFIIHNNPIAFFNYFTFCIVYQKLLRHLEKAKLRAG